MFSYDNLHALVEKEIHELPFPWPPESLYEPIRYILSLGGKRIRPILTLMTCNIFNDKIDNAITPAIGLEVFHNFTLLHDDLMDKADLRRNKPTVHKVWNANTAILSGDAMVIAAYELMGQTDPAYLSPVLNLFTQTALEICGGQQYDMEFESRDDVTEVEYIEMIRLKTAVLIACSMKTGAIIGGADEQDADRLYQFGIHIGLAFQLMDDLLDVYGDTKVFGKAIGGDILCNKKTFLLIHAFHLANEEQKEIMTDWINRTTFDPSEKISVFTSIYNTLQLKDLTTQKIEAYYQKAFDYLNSLNIDKEKLSALTTLSEELMYRQK